MMIVALVLACCLLYVLVGLTTTALLARMWNIDVSDPHEDIRAPLAVWAGICWPLALVIAAVDIPLRFVWDKLFSPFLVRIYYASGMHVWIVSILQTYL